jgi:hypothetical protein
MSMDSTLRLRLPRADRSIEDYSLVGTPIRIDRPTAPFNRIAYAAGHVVFDPRAPSDPWVHPVVDWERTLAFRQHLWGLGLGVAEAMDTAQRGMGFGWDMALDLIRRSASAAERDAQIVSGCGTDQLDLADVRSLDDVIAAYEEQMEAVEACGSSIVLMASRALAKVAKDGDDYRRVYSRLLQGAARPVVLHWLGPMFDPRLKGYWGHDDILSAMDVVTDIIATNASKIGGIKVSLLDASMEIALRARLPRSVKMYTGDDFNYVDLIAGKGEDYSHALLGAFNAVAPAASAALARLASGDEVGFREILGPTEPLSRHIFAEPTQFYKTGIVLMAYLNGHQDHFTMIGGMESARSTLHLADIFRLADRANLLLVPERAIRRMQEVLAVRGIES